VRADPRDFLVVPGVLDRERVVRREDVFLVVEKPDA
jgi:hypothetical protein